jgi:adenylate kinase
MLRRIFFLFLALSICAETGSAGPCLDLLRQVGAKIHLWNARIPENRVILFLGPAGSLKGTQAKSALERYQMETLSVGEELRRERAQNSELWRRAAPYYEAGKIAPGDVVDALIEKFILSVPRHIGILLDGSPRRIDQLVVIRRALKQVGRKIDLAVVFDISLETSIQRISGRLLCPKCQFTYHVTNFPPKRDGFCNRCTDTRLVKRSDDSPGHARARWETYLQDNVPIIAELEREGVVHRIDASRSATEVDRDFQRLLKDTKPRSILFRRLGLSLLFR